MFLKNIILIIFFFQFIHFFGQQTTLTGKLFSSDRQEALEKANVFIEGTQRSSTSNSEGIFKIKGNIPKGEQVLVVELKGFTSKRFPVTIVVGESVDLGVLTILPNIQQQQQYITTIDLNSVQDLDNDDSSQNQILLQANRDPFLSSVAFNWSSTFFKVRGLGNKYSKVLLNGVEMNSFFNRRPDWSNWSGLNDMLRSQEFTAYGSANQQTFGSLVGVNQLKFDATKYRKGSKVSFASTNRTYQGRLMATKHSGQLANGWAFSISASASRAKEGYVEGTLNRNYSIAGSISKILNDKNRLSFTTIYTPVKRGKSSPNTQEVIDIKGRQYNSYWGIQNEDVRNSRIKKVREPVFMLNHFLKPNSKLNIQNNILFQTGRTGNSRLEFNGRELSTKSTKESPLFIGTSRNPDPAYYQRLPSFFIKEDGKEDFESAFKAARNFRTKGQLNWNELYGRNKETATGVYALYEDVVADDFLVLNSIWNYELSSKISFQAKLAYRNLKSKNYAEINDLLGTKGFLDIDGFSEGNKAQNNLKTPDRVVNVGDRFRYNYNINASNLNGFIQVNFSIPKWEIFAAISGEHSNYERNGLFENGNYPANASLGKSNQVNFSGYGVKLGTTRQLTNKLYLSSTFNLAVTPPTIRQSFSNPRQNNDLVIGLENEEQFQFDASLNYQYGAIVARLSGYYIQRKNMTDVSFFFTENIASLGRTDSSAFVQEITTGIKTVNRGIEFGTEIKATNTLTVNMAMAYGQHVYANNPKLYITSDSFNTPLFLGESKLKEYHLANGPQQAYGLGFSYRDPSYWWFSTQLNYFSNAYIDISPFTRTQNFATDIDGQPLLDYDEDRAKELLEQEEFKGYFVWNAIGGKSWRLKNRQYLGFTLGVQNILNQFFKTGGFEQSRNSNFRDLNEDKNRGSPLFGNRYWLGNGATFYANTYWRF